MDKEGHPVEFSSEKISEKKQPDFFVASNEKAARRARSSVGAIFGKIGKSFKFVGAKFLGYIKHPFRGKHKIASIILIIVVVIATILIVLNFTIWQKQGKDTTPLNDEEMEKWGIELANISSEGITLSDEDFKTFYANHINDQRSEYKSIDLSLEYSYELSRRGYVDLALSILDSMDKDSMSCGQTTHYYDDYAFAYFMMGNGTSTSDSEYYSNLANTQETFCMTGEYPEEGSEDEDPTEQGEGEQNEE